MGMFDQIIYDEAPVPCYNCGKGQLDDFQSKDGPCTLSRLTPGQLVVLARGPATIYDYCSLCRTMNYYLVEPTFLPYETPEVPVTVKPKRSKDVTTA
jgi:hypothetical protein